MITNASEKPTDSVLMMTEAAGLTETLVAMYQNTRCHIPEDSDLHSHRREYTESHESIPVLQHHNFKTCGEMVVQLHSFVTSHYMEEPFILQQFCHKESQLAGLAPEAGLNEVA
jgi:hypothetical protein